MTRSRPNSDPRLIDVEVPRRPQSLLVEELAVACGSEGVLNVFQSGLLRSVRPGEGDDVEAGGVFEEAVRL